MCLFFFFFFLPASLRLSDTDCATHHLLPGAWMLCSPLQYCIWVHVVCRCCNKMCHEQSVRWYEISTNALAHYPSQVQIKGGNIVDKVEVTDHQTVP